MLNLLRAKNGLDFGIDFPVAGREWVERVFHT
jgi:hypothetical protein